MGLRWKEITLRGASRKTDELCSNFLSTGHLLARGKPIVPQLICSRK